MANKKGVTPTPNPAPTPGSKPTVTGDTPPEGDGAIPPAERIDIEKPLWDLSTFVGRFQHYLWVTDCRTVIESDETLDKAKELYYQYKDGQEPEGTTTEQALYAKKLFESAFHPDTHEKQNVFGRMSFQVPGNMFIAGVMMTFYRSIVAVVFWQWFNQSFNALVNYTNRNANATITETQLGVAYVSATTMAVTTALALKKVLRNTNPLFQRFVPFAAVAAANCVNVPLMRQNELLYGVDLNDADGNPVNVKSKIAPVKGISQVVLSRISMAAPGMMLIPVLMERCWMQKFSILHMPIQVLLMGATSIPSSTIEKYEPEQYAKLKKDYIGKQMPEFLYFNKGL